MENKILAVVNGIEITEQELQATIKRFPADRQSYLETDNGKKQLLDEIISFELVYNYAKDSGMEKDESYLYQLETAKKEILTQIAIAKVMSEATVSDKEVEQYYDANRQMFKEPEKIGAKHILVDTNDTAEEVLNNIKQGLSFEEAAQKYSSCPSKSQGGNLGIFGRGQMVPEFEDAAFNLEIGKISEPVKTQFGYHLIKVEEKFQGSIKSFEEVKVNIKNNLLQQRQSFKYSQLNDDLRKKYNVKILDN